MRFCGRWAALVRTILVGQPCWPWIFKEIKKIREGCVLEQEELQVQLREAVYEAEAEAEAKQAEARRSYSSV